jgi:hypothetical protein
VLDLAVEALALALIVGGVSALSHSHLIVGEDDPTSIRAGEFATSR